MKSQLIFTIFLVLGGCISRPRDNQREFVREGRENSFEKDGGSNDQISNQIRIPFINQNGVLYVQANVNGSPIKFVFDSGASDVTISVTEASYLLKNDYLNKSDFTGQQNYVDANGDVNVGVTFRINEMKLGSALLKNVNASVVNSRTASNLLGQSTLERFGKVSIDYKMNKILLEPR